MKTLTIDRSKWLCGKPPGALHRDGKFCCLGFFALQHCTLEGNPVRVEDLKDLFNPLDAAHFKGWPAFFIRGSSDDYTPFCGSIMSTNDDSMILPEVREQYISDAFACIGYTVEFTGDYPTRD